MADGTAIEWADASLTPIRARNKATGKIGHFCEHASDGCRFCYSEAFNRRGIGAGVAFQRQNRDQVELFLDEKMLVQPLHWRRPRRIFWNSMTDIFADFVPDEWIDRQFAVAALTPQHTHLFLTKRAKRMREYIGDRSDGCGYWEHWAKKMLRERSGHPGKPVLVGKTLAGTWPWPHAWLGCSVEDQARADERIPDLLATPAAVRFLSCEPLLGPVDLTRIPSPVETQEDEGYYHSALISDDIHYRDGDPDILTGRRIVDAVDGPMMPRIDWVIGGGESGPGARPCHPDWLSALRDQCVDAEVPFFFKQWGEWLPATEVGANGRGGFGEYPGARRFDMPPASMRRVGKKAAGRLLDGREWSEMPGDQP